MANAPATDWKEQIAPDEAERYERYGQQFAEFQRLRSARYGKGRALHRKQILALKGQFEVLRDLVDPARHGLFAEAGEHDAWIRLSNGRFNVRPDSTPDIRGFAIKVFGVSGPGALGSGPTQNQDFALSSTPLFLSPRSDEFVGLTVAATKGQSAVLRYMVRTHGLLGGFRAIRRARSIVNTPFSGFATSPFFSQAPIACGPYAAKVRLWPLQESATGAMPPREPDWASDMRSQLAKGPLVYQLQLQFFTDETTTPIEDGGVVWPEDVIPFLTVAQLTIPNQDLDSDDARAFAQTVEQSIFDPWNALMDHRPLGDIMRARKVVYYASQKERGAA
jgi:hypothetical protein